MNISSNISNDYESKLDHLLDFRRFGNEDDGNYTEFEEDGTMVAVGDAITYRDEYPNILIPASGAAAPDSVGHTIGGVARQLYSFDGNNTQEVLSGSIEIPHDYAIGMPIEIHVHWRPSTTGTGDVQWFFDYEYSAPNSAPSAQTALNAIGSIPSNQQYYHKLTSLGFLPDLGFVIGGKIGFNIRRTPGGTSDTYASDALLEQVAAHVPIDTLGSRSMYSK